MASIRVHRRRIVLPAVAVAVVMLVLAAGYCRGGSVGHMPSTEEEGREYREMKSKMAAEENADPSSESWTEWAKEKISGGLGLKNERSDDGGVKKVIDFTSDNAKMAKDKIQNVASEAGEYGAEKAKEVKDTAAEKAAEMAESAREAKDAAAKKTAEKAKEQANNVAKTASLKNKAEETSKEATEKAEEVKEKAKGKGKEAKEKAERAGEAMEQRKSWAKEGFEAAKGKAGEAVEAVKKKSKKIKDDVVRSEAEIGVEDEL